MYTYINIYYPHIANVYRWKGEDLKFNSDPSTRASTRAHQTGNASSYCTRSACTPIYRYTDRQGEGESEMRENTYIDYRFS